MGAEAQEIHNYNIPYNGYTIKAKVKVESILNQKHQEFLFEILVDGQNTGPKFVRHVILKKYKEKFSNLGQIINYLESILLK